MKKSLYQTHFRWWVSWYLSYQEVSDVMADYEPMIAHKAEQGETTLLQDLGTPHHAAWLLRDVREYQRWCIQFGLMCLCLFLPIIWILQTRFYQNITVLPTVIFLFGNLLSLFLFRPHVHQNRNSLPRGLLPILCATMFGILTTGSILWGLATNTWEQIPPRLYGTITHNLLKIMAIAVSVVGLYGLFMARMSDRRWRVLFVLALTVLAIIILILSILTSMDISFSGANCWAPYSITCSIWIVLGLGFGGASLC